MEIKVQRIHKFELEQPLKAFADITVNDSLLIRGIQVIGSTKGFFIQMPRGQAKDGKWYDTIQCLTPECLDQITRTILTAYKEK